MNPVTQLCASFHLPLAILSPTILLSIRNPRFSLECSRILRDVCVLAYVTGTVFSLTLKNSCVEYSPYIVWCPQQCAGRPTCDVHQS